MFLGGLHLPLKSKRRAQDLVHRGGIRLALHRHDVHRPRADKSRRTAAVIEQHLLCAERARLVARGQSLNARCLVDPVSQQAVLHPLDRADVPRENVARVYADAAPDEDLGAVRLHEHATGVDLHVDVLGSSDTCERVVRDGPRRVEHGEDLVGDELEQRAPMLLNYLPDDVEDILEEPQDVLTPEAAAFVLEAVDVHEEDSGVALRNSDGGLCP
mmetsp:Transcript_14829/g.38454  ORF Transcript_14829/g.38454 Transcript_14829/m.38454 type:complete len:215 (-) Transcript_14829:344-988(-)